MKRKNVRDEIKEALEQAIKAEDEWNDILQGRNTELDDYGLQLYRKQQAKREP